MIQSEILGFIIFLLESVTINVIKIKGPDKFVKWTIEKK